MSSCALLRVAPLIWPSQSPPLDYYSSNRQATVVNTSVPRWWTHGCVHWRCCSSKSENKSSAEGPSAKDLDKELRYSLDKPKLTEKVWERAIWTEEELFRAYNREELEYRMSDEEWESIVESLPPGQKQEEAREQVRVMKEEQEKADDELRQKCRRIAKELRKQEPSEPAQSMEKVWERAIWTEEELFRAHNREELESRMSDEVWEAMVEELPLPSEQRDEARDRMRIMKERHEKADAELREKCRRIAEELRKGAK